MNGKDPYKVLGVSPTASDTEIKAAYKELVKKYHPDQYQDNPLADVAAEKMAEINTAYDEIMTGRRNGGYSGGSSYGAGSQGFDSNYVRSLIQSGSITAADQLLDNVSMDMRNGEWYFLKGSVCYKRGWLNEAYNHFSRAVQLEPGNAEYSAALAQMNRQRSGYMNGNPTQGYSTGAMSGPDCCTSLCCADCCCEMMGGDLIPCC